MRPQLKIRPEFVNIPSALFTDRKLAVLESLVRYLHEEEGFTFREISLMINRNERTIYTVYRRSCAKNALICKSRGEKVSKIKP